MVTYGLISLYIGKERVYKKGIQTICYHLHGRTAPPFRQLYRWRHAPNGAVPAVLQGTADGLIHFLQYSREKAYRKSTADHLPPSASKGCAVFRKPFREMQGLNAGAPLPRGRRLTALQNPSFIYRFPARGAPQSPRHVRSAIDRGGTPEDISEKVDTIRYICGIIFNNRPVTASSAHHARQPKKTRGIN